MRLRIWKTGFDQARRDDLEKFACERSANMFRKLPGCLGFAFVFDGNEWMTMSMWTTDEAIAEAEASDTYRSVLEAILAQGFLTGDQTTEVFEVMHWEPPSYDVLP